MSEIQVPPQVGPYEIVKQLGRGGMGAVYLAKHTSLDRTVALKVLLQDGRTGGDELALKRFKLEAEIAMTIVHPNLVRVWDYGEDDGLTYLAMECVSGTTLSDAIAEEGRLPVARALKAAREMLSALDALHTKGVTHRDLKPANVMIDDQGAARVLDMGLVKVVDRTVLTREGMMVGSPRYLAPEVVAGEEYDHRADLYQVGLILYEAIAGQPAFHGAHIPTLLQKIVVEPPPPIEVEGPEAERVQSFLKLTLGKYPKERFPSAAAALAHLTQPLKKPGARTGKVGVSSASIPRPPVSASVSVAPSFASAKRGAPWIAAALVVAGLAVAGLVRRSPPSADPLGPRPSASASAAPSRPPADAPPTGRDLVLRLTAALTRSSRESWYPELMGALPAGPKRDAALAMWRARCEGLVHENELAKLAALFRAEPECVFAPDLTRPERLAFEVARIELTDLEAAVRAYTGSGCGLPAAALAGPENTPRPAPPPGARAFIAIEFSKPPSPPDRRAYLNQFQHVIHAGEPATFGRSNSNIFRRGEPPVRKMWRDKLLPAPPAPPREVWAGFRLVGGGPTEQLHVRYLREGERSVTVAELRADDNGGVREGFVRVDPRYLTSPHFGFALTYAFRPIRAVSAGVTLERFGLWIVEGGPISSPASTPGAPPAAR